jgi:hypothetical protein
MSKWWRENPKDVVEKIYWLRDQLPPKNWQAEWPKIKAQLLVKYPPPVMLRNQAE